MRILVKPSRTKRFYYKHGSKVTYVGKEVRTECWGCKENQPNQMAHMDPGGCLSEEVIRTVRFRLRNLHYISKKMGTTPRKIMKMVERVRGAGSDGASEMTSEITAET